MKKGECKDCSDWERIGSTDKGRCHGGLPTACGTVVPARKSPITQEIELRTLECTVWRVTSETEWCRKFNE